MSARVSVLLPVRDARATLDECLASLAAQTLADHEIVAVDDGSTDGSAEILETAARSDPRVRVVHTPRRGLVAALNLALAQAGAALVARMDADDIAAPERLAVQYQRLSADAATDVLGCRVRLLGGQANLGMRAYVDWQNTLVDHVSIARDLWVESPLVHPSVMMRAGALSALGGYRDFDGPEDYDLWLRGYAAGWRFAKVAQELLLWRDGPRRLTRTDARYAPSRFLALKVGALLRGPLRDAPGAVVWGAGKLGKALARELLAHGAILSAFVEVDPRKIGGRIHGAPVVGVDEATRFAGFHLAAVGQAGARERIRHEAGRRGLIEGRDLLAVA